MKKHLSTFDKVVFIIVPTVIILIGICLCIYSYRVVCVPHISKEDITDKTQSGELYRALRIKDENSAYIVYTIGNDYHSKKYNDNNMIAFKGSSLNELERTIYECGPVKNAISYWEGEADLCNLTDNSDFEQFLVRLQNNAQQINTDVVKENYSNITVYDIKDYKGYHQKVDNDSLLGLYLNYAFVIVCAPILIVLEIGIALMIRTCRRKCEAKG